LGRLGFVQQAGSHAQRVGGVSATLPCYGVEHPEVEAMRAQTHRLTALTRAARVLVGVDDARVRDLLDDLLRTLEGGDQNVVTLAAKRTTRR
jgi:hypothetical protein